MANTDDAKGSPTGRMRPLKRAGAGGGADAAAALALRGLGWLADDPDELEALMGAAGLTPAALRARAGEPEFLGFVLDFVLADETRARRFAEHAGLGPEDALRARAALPGGDAVHWT